MVIESTFTRKVDEALADKRYSALEHLIEDQHFITYRQDDVETLLEMFLDEIKQLREKVDKYEKGMLIL